MSALLDALLGIGSGVLDVLDMPGSYLRGALGGKFGDRLSGREMLDEWGVTGENDPDNWFEAGDIAGFGAEMIADPLNALGGVKLLKMLKARKPNLPISVSSGIHAGQPEDLISKGLGHHGRDADDAFSLAMSEGQELGRATIHSPDMIDESGVASRMFPGMVEPGSRVARESGVYLDDAARGRGVGQQMYVDALSKTPADWVYNSSNSDDLTKVLESLSGKGLIDLHWKGKAGGPKLVRLTDDGRGMAGTDSLIRDVENPSLSPLLAALLGYNTLNAMN